MHVQSGQLSENEFMDEIRAFITAIVESNAKPIEEYISLFQDEKTPALGKCPRCGSNVCESTKGFFCQNRTCGFCLWKDSKFWTSKKAELTAEIVSALLKDRRVKISGLYSQKTGKTYSAIISLDDTGTFVNYKMEFPKR
jgi:DNA topoisomerase-3